MKDISIEAGCVDRELDLENVMKKLTTLVAVAALIAVSATPSIADDPYADGFVKQDTTENGNDAATPSGSFGGAPEPVLTTVGALAAIAAALAGGSSSTSSTYTPPSE